MKNLMKIYSYKTKRFSKSSSFTLSLYHSVDNPLYQSNQLIKIQNKTLNINNLFSMKKIPLRNKNITPKNIFKKESVSLINLPGIANLDLLKKKLFSNSKEDNLYKTRNIQNQNKIKINLKLHENSPSGSLLFFDSSLKHLYNNNKILKNNKIYQEEKIKKKNELYFDYDENNYYIKHNSFSGNNPNILKKKVLFVKNIFDYIYPKIVINRMKFIDQKKLNEIKYKVNNLTKKFNNKYYFKKYKSPEENSIFSKYHLKGAVHDEAIKIKGNCIQLKKVMVNGKLATQLAKNYDYIYK